MNLKDRISDLRKKVEDVLNADSYSDEMHLQEQVEEAFLETMAEIRNRGREVEDRINQIEVQEKNHSRNLHVESTVEKLASEIYEESRAEKELSELMLTILQEDLENVPESEKKALKPENLEYYGSHRDTMRNVKALDSPADYDPASAPEFIAWCPNHGIAIMDHHNYAMLFWLAYTNSRRGKPGVFHLDEHEDMQQPDKIPGNPPETVGQAERYVEQVGINEFIQPFLDWGLLSSFYNYSEGGDSGGIRIGYPEQEVEPHLGAEIFDLDLDFFNKVDGSEYLDGWYDMAARCIQEAELTTIATSPRYIDPEDAARHYREILSRLP